MYVSLPIIKTTLTWLFRVSNTKVMLACFFLATLLPSSTQLQGVAVMMPLMMGAQGVSTGIRQDCLELLFCRPISKSCFVFSKWLAYMLTMWAILPCHIPILLVMRDSFQAIAVKLLALFLSTCIASAAGALIRVLIIDPKRQGICLMISLVTGFLFGVDIDPKAMPYLPEIKKFLCPTLIHDVFGQATCSVGLTDICLAILNTAFFLSIAILVMKRQQMSYSFDT